MTRLDQFLQNELPLCGFERETVGERIIVKDRGLVLSPVVAAARRKSLADLRWFTAAVAKALDLSFEEAHRLHQASYEPHHPLRERLLVALRPAEPTPTALTPDPVIN